MILAPRPALVAAVVAMATTASAPAGASVRVLLWPEAGTAGAPDVEAELAGALRRRVPDVVPSSALAQAPEVAARARADAEELQHVEAALAKARRAYLAFDFDGARSGLDEIATGQLEVLSRPAQIPLLAGLHRLAGEVEIGAGRTPRAREHALAAALLSPESPPRGSVTPEYVQLEVAARADLGRLASRPLRLASDPPGADCFVDGRRVGATPVVVDVPLGPHVVRLELPGRLVWARAAAVAAAGATLDAALPSDPQDAVLLRRLARGAVDPADGETRRVLLERALASHVVSYRLEAALVAVRVHGISGGPASVVGSGSPSSEAFADRIADAVLGIAASPRDRTAGALRSQAPPPEASPPLYRHWWFWAGAGVLAAGATAGIAIATRPEQRAIVRPGP